MKAKEFYNKRAFKHQLKRAIKHDKQYFEDTIIELMEMYAQEQVKKLTIPVVSDFYYLKDGDEILKDDEYLDIDRGEVWFVTGQVGKKYRSGYHYKHRRKI